MQLLTATDEPSSEDIEPDSFSVTIIPTASAPPATATNEPNAVLTTEDKPEQNSCPGSFSMLFQTVQTYIQTLFKRTKTEIKVVDSLRFWTGNSRRRHRKSAPANAREQWLDHC